MMLRIIVLLLALSWTARCANLRLEENQGCISSTCQRSSSPFARFSQRMKRSTTSFNDPMYDQQWYLNDKESATMNIKKAWEAGYNGQGVVISVIDVGLQKDHDEFKDRFDQRASYNFIANKDDPTPDPGNVHGCKVGGVAAGQANNNQCGVGIAHAAKIGGITAFATGEDDIHQPAALSHANDYVDIYACAWGPDGVIGNKVGYNLAPGALENGTKYGRQGKGNIYVFATGNEGLRPFNDSCTYDGYVTDVNTLAVTNINFDGTPSMTSERCPSILAAAYARDGAQPITDKTHLMPTAVLENKCTDIFSATSAATGVASGIFALVLQANPNLSYRDIQHIVANTSQNSETIAKEGRWFSNGAGFRVSDRYGFGVLDAMAMINRAKNWKNVPKRISCEKEFTTTTVIPADASQLSFDVDFTGQNCNIRHLEHVKLVVNLTYTPRKSLQLDLVSPANTLSHMLMGRNFDINFNDIIMFPTMTLHNWGESSVGRWQIKFSNNGPPPQNPGELRYYKLVLYGTETLPIQPDIVKTTARPQSTTTRPQTTKKKGNSAVNKNSSLILVSLFSLLAILKSAFV
eukprot:TCONS_00057329-protein